ncbi:MAG: NYN domain-containing protein [Deltaproteobacteria bacterium]|nr:NYN domain-containing protein [Deltaproteobacteria bacterium]MBW2070447.1 NYN domain-containing protein [Deltaproteobacteria bacterium]
MALHLLIDGYNLIRRSSRFGPQDELALELGRNSLLESLRRYKQLKGCRITVVFDGAHKVHLGREQGREKGISIIYSAPGETADEVIKSMCRKYRAKLTVVTSDRDLAGYVESCDAVAIDSEEFEARMEMAFLVVEKGEEEEPERWEPKRGTRKKGPARRRSKKERRRQQRWRKL